MEKKRSQLGNRFFKFIATWESLVIGHIINNTDLDLGFSGLYESSLGLEALTELSGRHGIADDLGILLPDKNNRDSCKLYLELLGNTKHFGHPCLDVLAGFGTVREHGTEPIAVNMDIVSDGISIMRRDFVKNYIMKKRSGQPASSFQKN